MKHFRREDKKGRYKVGLQYKYFVLVVLVPVATWSLDTLNTAHSRMFTFKRPRVCLNINPKDYGKIANVQSIESSEKGFKNKMPTWWSAPTTRHAYWLSWISLAITAFAASGGIALYAVSSNKCNDGVVSRASYS